MFKAVFLYAVVRGILDHLTGRPDLHERLAKIELARVFTAAQPVAAELAGHLRRIVFEMRLYWLAHPELWQQPHDENWRP